MRGKKIYIKKVSKNPPYGPLLDLTILTNLHDFGETTIFEDTNLSNALFGLKNIKTMLARGLNTAKKYLNETNSLKNPKKVSKPHRSGPH